jgi:hypothetical protein
MADLKRKGDLAEVRLGCRRAGIRWAEDYLSF